MPLLRVPDAFDHPDWLFELKHDGFRALAKIDGHQCTLVSRRRHVYRQFPQLQEEIAHAIRAHAALLDDEIVYLASDGRSVFNRLLFRETGRISSPSMCSRLTARTCARVRCLSASGAAGPLPRIQSRLVFMDHVTGRGSDLFAEVCAQDLEGHRRREVEARRVSQRRTHNVLAEDSQPGLLDGSERKAPPAPSVLRCSRSSPRRSGSISRYRAWS